MALWVFLIIEWHNERRTGNVKTKVGYFAECFE